MKTIINKDGTQKIEFDNQLEKYTYFNNKKRSRVFVSEKILSEITGRSLSAIRKDRLKGQGPRFIKYATGQVLYDMDDVEAYLDANKRSSTSAPKIA